MRLRWLILITVANVGLLAGVLVLAARIEHTKSECIRTLALAQKRAAEMHAAEKEAKDTYQKALDVRDEVLRRNPCIDERQ